MNKRVLREAIKKILLEKMLETMNKFRFFFFKNVSLGVLIKISRVCTKSGRSEVGEFHVSVFPWGKNRCNVILI